MRLRPEQELRRPLRERSAEEPFDPGLGWLGLGSERLIETVRKLWRDRVGFAIVAKKVFRCGELLLRLSGKMGLFRNGGGQVLLLFMLKAVGVRVHTLAEGCVVQAVFLKAAAKVLRARWSLPRTASADWPVRVPISS